MKKTIPIEKAVGRPMLQWDGKKPLDKVEPLPAQEKERYGDLKASDFNKLFWGDNLQVLAHLLKEYRGKIDLIYIDPPFDSKAEYIKKVKIRGERVEGTPQSLLEEKQYSDIWGKDEYLQFMYERLLVMRELLTSRGVLCLHCDWHKAHLLRLVLEEVFGESGFINEIIWFYPNTAGRAANFFPRKHDNIFVYSNAKDHTFNKSKGLVAKAKGTMKRGEYSRTMGGVTYENVEYQDDKKLVEDVWELAGAFTGKENTKYPTQKPEKLLTRLVEVFSNEGDVVADFFCGSGTTPAVAQKYGRRWVACDINIGAIQTTTKRLNEVVQEQLKKKTRGKPTTPRAFKVYNVNHYDVFKNGVEARELLLEAYQITPLKQGYFDGVLDNNFVKIISPNRVLNKRDITEIIKETEKHLDLFTIKKTSKLKGATYEQGVYIICSGADADAQAHVKRENNTGVVFEIKDIQTDKKNLVFKQKPEADIAVSVKNKVLTVAIKEFHSPILLRKLELENEKALKKKDKTKVADFRQIIDSVAIDADYDGKLFNAEVIDVPAGKDLIAEKHTYEYSKKGKYTVAVRVIDVLGEEFLDTYNVTA